MKSMIALSVLFAALFVSGIACHHVAPAKSESKPAFYTCPMHPSVKTKEPGDCPICGMKLTPVLAGSNTAPAASCGMACCATPEPTKQP